MTYPSSSVPEVSAGPVGPVAGGPAGPGAVAPCRDVFADARTGSTVLRASWHEGLGCVVLSMWRRDRCVATFHLPAADVDRLADVLGSAATAAGRTAVVRTAVEPVG